MKKFRKASPVPIPGNEYPAASGLPHGRTAPDLASFPEAFVARGWTAHGPDGNIRILGTQGPRVAGSWRLGCSRKPGP